METIKARAVAAQGNDSFQLTRRDLLGVAVLGVAVGAPGVAAAASPAGRLTCGIHVSMAPSWFDPAETQGIITPFMAFEGYWRKLPSVKRVVMRLLPDEATRLAALKRGEVGIAYSIRGELAEGLVKAPGLTLKSVVLQAPNGQLGFLNGVDPRVGEAAFDLIPGFAYTAPFEDLTLKSA
jgi:hypothetical protein